MCVCVCVRACVSARVRGGGGPPTKKKKKGESVSLTVVSDPLQPHGL